MVALVADYLRPYREETEQAVPAGLDLLEAVDVFARYHRRSCDAPDALSRRSLQITLLDMAPPDPDPGLRLATSVRAQESHLIAPQYFADTARALVSGMSLIDHGVDLS